MKDLLRLFRKPVEQRHLAVEKQSTKPPQDVSEKQYFVRLEKHGTYVSEISSNTKYFCTDLEGWFLLPEGNSPFGEAATLDHKTSVRLNSIVQTAQEENLNG